MGKKGLFTQGHDSLIEGHALVRFFFYGFPQCLGGLFLDSLSGGADRVNHRVDYALFHRLGHGFDAAGKVLPYDFGHYEKGQRVSITALEKARYKYPAAHRGIGYGILCRLCIGH